MPRDTSMVAIIILKSGRAMVLDNFQWRGAVEKEHWMRQGGERLDCIQTHVSYFSFRPHL